MGFPGTFGSPLALSAIEIAIQLALHFRAPFLVAVTAHPTKEESGQTNFTYSASAITRFLFGAIWVKLA